jgi:hypothetical protein
MIFYFFDFNTDIILYADRDPYLVSSLAEGVINCKLGQISIPEHLEDKLLGYTSNISTGLKYDLNTVEVKQVGLHNYPELQKNKELILLREDAFKALLQSYNLCLFKSNFGFNDLDILTLSYAIANKNTVEDYARITGSTPEFAKSELSVIQDSILQERFRAYTTSLLFKNQINGCNTTEGIKDIIIQIGTMFFNLGARDA